MMIIGSWQGIQDLVGHDIAVVYVVFLDEFLSLGFHMVQHVVYGGVFNPVPPVQV